MQSSLNHLSAVPAVVGSMLCDADGRVLARAFPPHVDPATLVSAAATLTNGTVGLESVTGAVGIVDLRFGESRIVVKPLGGGHLLFLCARSVNLQMLVLACSAVVPKLERLIAARRSPAEPGAVLDANAAGGPAGRSSHLHDAVVRIEEIIAKRDLPAFKTKGAIGIKAGFALGLIDASTPDDPGKLASLKAAAREVLGEVI
jgi:predicted regulator of Ras-like GTPase activity (Roadblock/LC7/MglB family)